MSKDLPFVGFGFGDQGQKIGIVGAREFEFLTDMFIDASFIRDPANITLLAKGLNHFDQGMEYALIEDIDGFSENYRKTFAAEEDQPFDQFISSISNFEMPDLDQLAPPKITDEQIVFYVVHQGLDMPYRVTGAADGRSKLTYSPL
ncbi:MAG: hypothetical protein JKY31_06705 [Rhodobacteraceae bacterium]|nr:hypothetical protein [Paracoccaceae bacterium]